MSRIREVLDPSCPELDCFARLTEAQLRNRLEPEKGLFICESAKAIRVALDAGCVPQAFLMERRHLKGQGAELLARCPEVPVYTGERELLQSLTGYPVNRGILCAMIRPKPRTMEQVCHGARRLAVLENITDAVNVGAVFRSAAALGVDGMLVTAACCDPLNRRAVRVSMGTVLQIPWAVLENWPQGAMRDLHGLGFQTVALALAPEAMTIEDRRLKEVERLAVVLGTEGDGLAARTIAECDYVVRIPMAAGVDSLNVAAAGALAFWELRVPDGQGTGERSRS